MKHIKTLIWIVSILILLIIITIIIISNINKDKKTEKMNKKWERKCKMKVFLISDVVSCRKKW